jgi:hypothetical protein
MVMTSHVLGKLNGERVRIHFPREIAANALKQNSEELLRPEHKRKLKRAVEEVKNSTALVKRFFGRGGRRQARGGGIAPVRRFQKRGYSYSFPQSRSHPHPFHPKGSAKQQKPIRSQNRQLE